MGLIIGKGSFPLRHNNSFSFYQRINIIFSLQCAKNLSLRTEKTEEMCETDLLQKCDLVKAVTKKIGGYLTPLQPLFFP